jgi:tRNA(Ile2)-agmatinylcytidine synthase
MGYRMLIGIDDTDSPEGMCTTYLGAILARRLTLLGMILKEARLIRLNPNVIWKTRGNAAVCLEVEGDPKTAFRTACRCVEDLAEMDCDLTNPGVVVVRSAPDSAFYRKAVQDFCELEEALGILRETGALYRGYNEMRGLIGATAAVSSAWTDCTYELLAYRMPELWGTARSVHRESHFLADRTTYPHTWDTVDRENDLVVCVPHTPDPVLFGIRGERPGWLMYARECVLSETPALEQTFVTNQGTDAHLVQGEIGALRDGRSYLVRGIVAAPAITGRGGHVSMMVSDGHGACIRCMAYEPTKGFRDVLRALRPGDEIVAAGSWKGDSINLEKILVERLSPPRRKRPPVCPACRKRMTSAGREKGYKCRGCGGRMRDPVYEEIERTIAPGWYEVPPSARRHLAKPLCRGPPLIPR